MTTNVAEKLRAAIIRGALFLAPLILSIVVLNFAYNLVDAAFGSFADEFVRRVLPASWLKGPLAEGHIPGVSLIMALLLLSFVGALAAFRHGQIGLNFVDSVLHKTPVLRLIYSSARNVVDSFGEQGGESRFRKVVFLDWTPGLKTMGFVTNEIPPAHEGDVKRYIIYVPMMPNPTSGVVVVVPTSAVVETDMRVDDALKFGLSLGVLTPPAMNWERI